MLTWSTNRPKEKGVRACFFASLRKFRCSFFNCCLSIIWYQSIKPTGKILKCKRRERTLYWDFERRHTSAGYLFVLTDSIILLFIKCYFPLNKYFNGDVHFVDTYKISCVLCTVYKSILVLERRDEFKAPLVRATKNDQNHDSLSVNK